MIVILDDGLALTCPHRLWGSKSLSGRWVLLAGKLLGLLEQIRQCAAETTSRSKPA